VTSVAVTARPSFEVWRKGPTALLVADIAAMLVALTLPWSTTASAVFTLVWAVAALLTADSLGAGAALRHPASRTAMILLALGALGTLWADVAWPDRLVGLGRFIKLLAIPLLIYHFRKSERGIWVFAAFLASCILLLSVSYLQAVFPQLARSPIHVGVPVKNYIVQGQEFTLCVFGLAYCAFQFFRDGRRTAAVAASALALLFIANMLFVISSRTALLVMVVLLFLFCLRFLRGRALIAVLIGAGMIAGLGWSLSPSLRQRASDVLLQIEQYQQSDAVTSAGQRLEYWRKSLRFVAEAPLIGHGTGSIQSLFERAAVGKTGIEAEVINNPHNQTLAIAVQLGLVGVIALYAMWFAHLRLFTGTGLAAWVGLAVVTQNFVGSLLNSHLFDSAEGWIYVFGVGIAAGMVLREQDMIRTAS
jgi:O-antigen ligase